MQHNPLSPLWKLISPNSITPLICTHESDVAEFDVHFLKYARGEGARNVQFYVTEATWPIELVLNHRKCTGRAASWWASSSLSARNTVIKDRGCKWGSFPPQHAKKSTLICFGHFRWWLTDWSLDENMP